MDSDEDFDVIAGSSDSLAYKESLKKREQIIKELAKRSKDALPELKYKNERDEALAQLEQSKENVSALFSELGKMAKRAGEAERNLKTALEENERLKRVLEEAAKDILGAFLSTPEHVNNLIEGWEKREAMRVKK